MISRKEFIAMMTDRPVCIWGECYPVSEEEEKRRNAEKEEKEELNRLQKKEEKKKNWSFRPVFVLTNFITSFDILIL